MKLTMTYNGKPFNGADLIRDVDQSIVKIVKQDIPAQIAEDLQDPDTGEKPTVTFQGSIHSLHDLNGSTIKIEGSPKMINRARKHFVSEDT